MSRTFTYDAENRQVSANISGAIASYGYDGLGQRVSKTVSSVTTTYVYDAFGNLAAEYGSPDPSACGTPTCYVTVDHLGSARMLTDGTGSSNVRRYDYQPFGAEIPAGYGGRTSTMGYLTAPDSLGPKFTGQFRDSEISLGLDWFNVRYMSGAQGRFQSVDPANAGVAIGDPQTWNAYAYVGNNPLSYTDPSGEGLWSTLWNGTLWIFYNILLPLGTGGLSSLFGGSSPGLTGCGGPLGNCGGDIGAGPWSEQSPISVSVQDPGRFILDIERQSNSAFDKFGDFVAGAGDNISFGLTIWARRKIGGEAVDFCSGSYRAGRWTGTALSLATGVAGGVKAAGTAAKGVEFSHWIPARFGGPRSILNGNYVSTAEHALSDPRRYRFMPRAWKEANPLPSALTQQLNRLPNVLNGTAIGGAYGAVSQALSAPSCEGR